MTAFICLLGLGILIYIYRLFSQLGGGGGLAEASPDSRLPTTHWAIPVALGTGWLVKATALTLLIMPLRVLCHEVGHSLVAWLGGCWSFPSISGHAITDYDPSVIVSVMAAFGIIWVIWQGAKLRSAMLFSCGAALAAGFVYFHFFAGEKRLLECILFAGHAGEFVFPVLLIAAFYAKGPSTWRWDWFRYPLMAAAAWQLSAAWQFWTKAAGNPVMNIYGASIYSATVVEQDIARLVNSMGWTPRMATDLYLLLGKISWLCVLLVYAGGILKTHMQSRANTSKSEQ